MNREPFQIIMAMTKKCGIGHKGRIPWKCPEEQALFKKKTMNSFLIVGRKTYDTLPKLPGREVYVLSTKCLQNLNDIYEDIYAHNTFGKHGHKPAFIAGGAVFLEYFLERYLPKFNGSIDVIFHLSIMKDDYPCDTFIKFDFSDWYILEKTDYKEFTHFVCKKKAIGESQYLKLLKKVFDMRLSPSSERKGRNGITISSFGNNLEYDMKEGFPLLTTKKMFLRGIIEELLFFLRGETDTSILEQKGINIWKGNTSGEFLSSKGLDYKEGSMGPMYGWQFRRFNQPYKEGGEKNLDQLKYVIDLIKTDPYSRRILMTSYNPLQASEGVLYPCHSIILQFYVDQSGLSLYCYNRSSDLFHGLPFNIASSALLLIIISKVTGYKPAKLYLGLGDSHIYSEHYSAVEEQLGRIPYESPKIEITKEINTLEDIEKLTFEDFSLNGYSSHQSIKAPMIA